MATLVLPPLPAHSEEVLFRHINPDWLDEEGLPSSQAFRPFDERNLHLSVDLSSKATVEDCHTHYTVTLGNKSAGVWGVTPADCNTVDLKAYWAPIEDNKAHGAIDYTGVSLNKPARNKSKVLARRARERGRLYPPGEEMTQSGFAPANEASRSHSGDEPSQSSERRN